MIKMKYLEEKLQLLHNFEKPNLLLEQYSTSSHIASRMLHVAETQFGDIYNCSVADLGAGCGIFSVGAFMLGASYVAAFEIDTTALNLFTKNCKKLDVSVDILCCDITRNLPGRFEKLFDTIIMNPPFGTKHNVGMDTKFLDIASRLSRNAIYSLHKSSTRLHILRKGAQYGFHGEVLAQLRYNLPQTYKFHKKKSVDIEVDFIRFMIKK